MAQDFYLKAQALHEEFQKRELHYLNVERKLKNTVSWNKDLNLTLQGYLQKINQREKETEETYRNIMKKMEELDHHTDAMSLKLEKLGILRARAATAMTPSWIQNLDFNIGSKHQTYTTDSFYSASNIVPLNLKSVSSQTENSIYCKNCNSPILTYEQSSHVTENLPTLSSPFGISDKTNVLQLPNSRHNSHTLLNNNLDIPSTIELKGNEPILVVNDKDPNYRNCEIEKINENIPEQKIPSNVVEIQKSSLQNELQQSKDSTAETTQEYLSKSEEELSLSKPIMNENNIAAQTADVHFSIDTFVTKSDVESMNNEFDFLESDVASVTLKSETHTLKNVKISTNPTKEHSVNVPTLEEAHPVEPKKGSKTNQHEIKDKNLSPVLNVVDDKSETSGSISGFHSPNISVASDSDSIYEKGSPSKASAAYQALLGNTALPRKTPQIISDSESEDEVESALASAVQRTNVKSKSMIKQKKDETPIQQEDAKPIEKSKQQSSVSKTQSKLSKSTRKVLGLDTSSGSEVEMALKPTSEKKIEEDSDEFDFYD